VDGRDKDVYLAAEARARVEIDKKLAAAGWVVQHYRDINLGAGQGVAVREFPLEEGHGRADYLLFVDRRAVGVIEAKPDGTPLTGVEWQSAKYTTGLPDHVGAVMRPLPFAYESTGNETRFTNHLDPEPASRRVFAFHRPSTLAEWSRDLGDPETATLRARLRHLPDLDEHNLWPPQARAIRNLERSLVQFRARSLIQMATGSGKTYTAANIAYRLIRFGDAKRILFLVDRANLGRQTKSEFERFEVPGTGRKFTELYNVQHLSSNTIDAVARVVITTIQRLYSILRGEEQLDPEVEEHTGFESEPSQPVVVDYNPKVPIETFDVIVVDECHRSIYGVWRQVLDYFDAFTIGLTATPGKQTLGFFDQNLVMEYGHDEAVADNVNVDFDVYRIRTEITERGSKVDAGLVTRFRDRETRAERFEKLDHDYDYDESALDRRVVAKDQIRSIIRTFRHKLPEIFPGRDYVPKTLIFAKTDSHADDIVQIVREEFGKGNDFAAKITYNVREPGRSAEQLLRDFRTGFNPRIAVTVDMIATGTDVKPIECVFFMRMVKSRNFFEQMKGRGVRVINPTDLKAVTPDADSKDHFVIIDAVGVTESELSDTQPLERQPAVAFDKLLQQVAVGDRNPDVASSLAARLARLNAGLTAEDRAKLEATAGRPLPELIGGIVDALDPDRQLSMARAKLDRDPSEAEVAEVATRLIDTAVQPIADNPDLRRQLVDVRRIYEQLIDETSKDSVVGADYSKDATERAKRTVDSFRHFLEENRDEITALQILYRRPYSERKLTFAQVKELGDAIAMPPHRWTPDQLWDAYETLDASKVRGSPKRVLTDLVALVRYALELDDELVAYPETVAERFDGWLRTQEQAGRRFTPQQRAWLEQIRDHIAASLRITADDFDYAPFVEHGGIGKAYELFGDELTSLLDELNQELVA
jgi:type I restriction enzyme, R subunit